jgi:hypothetical protein
MRYVLEDVEARMLTDEMRRRGIADRQRLHVTVETLGDDLPLAKFAEEGGSFAFLADEPDLYSLADIRAPE